jgi:TetR/AcrR family transcriptional repressor of lmrAB and yxaGH operons
VADTRERMIQAAVGALRRSGVAGMSFTQVLADSGAARGAIYHHFPGGKGQLVAEAAARNAEEVRAQLAMLPAVSPAAVVEAFLAAVRPVVAAGAAGSSCAVAAIAMGVDDEGDGSPRHVADSAFRSWIDALAARFVAAGLSAQDGADLANGMIIMLEGAHVLCRASGDLAAFEQAARITMTLVRGRYRDE